MKWRNVFALDWKRIITSVPASFRSEQVRLPLQITVAAVATYLAASLLGIQSRGWAVISAVFVVHGTMDGTLASALWRVGGAIAGGAIALVCVLTIGTGGFATIASLGISIAATGLLLMRFPRMAFGLVAASILVISPGFEVVEGAFEKATAIAMGALIGVGVTFLLFRQRAHRQVSKELGLALSQCGTVVEASTQGMLGEGNTDAVKALRKARAHVGFARERAGEIRYDFVGRHPNLSYQELIDTVDDVRHAVGILGQLRTFTLPRQAVGTLGRPIQSAASALSNDIDMLAESLRTTSEAKWPRDSIELSEQVSSQIESVRASQMEALPIHASARIFVASFAIDMVADGLKHVAELLGAERPATQKETSIAA